MASLYHSCFVLIFIIPEVPYAKLTAQPSCKESVYKLINIRIRILARFSVLFYRDDIGIMFLRALALPIHVAKLRSLTGFRFYYWEAISE